MPYRLYLVPSIGTGESYETRHRPKYFDGIPHAGMPYGYIPMYFVAANLTPEQDAFIAAQSDVYAFPFNLDTTLTANQVTAAVNAFEAALIPAQWVNAALTWRAVARTIAGMFQFMQRLHYMYGNRLPIDGTASKNLNTRWQQLPVDVRDAILAACASLNYSTAFITDNTQMRSILKALADRWGNKSFIFNEFIL